MLQLTSSADKRHTCPLEYKPEDLKFEHSLQLFRSSLSEISKQRDYLLYSNTTKMKIKVLLILAVTTFCLVSSAKEGRAADNEWLPYFIMMSGAGAAPISLAPTVLISVCVGALLFTNFLGSSGPQSQKS